MLDDLEVTPPAALYRLDEGNLARLTDSAPLAWEWSRVACAAKPTGGMEEWAKGNGDGDAAHVHSCDWYHGTWQLLRMLNMVAVPPWYEFYQQTLTALLARRPDAEILISAAADYGMLATLHEAILAAGAAPRITLCDICTTPLLGSQWYAEREGVDNLTCVCDDLMTTEQVPAGAFDLIVTDELLTVLKAEDKPRITDRWLHFLKPGGTVVTTVMIGEPTTPERRAHFARRAATLLDVHADRFRDAGATRQELLHRFETFAAWHTRHMVTGEDEIRALFAGFAELDFSITVTPGECVNPTSSFQIVAVKEAGDGRL